MRADSTIAKNLSASGVRPLEHTPFDSQEVEALLQEYHRGDAELIPVLDYLTVLIGARYHQIISTLLNNITKDLGGDSLIPYVTAVAAARQSYLAEVGNASAGPSGSNMDQGQAN